MPRWRNSSISKVLKDYSVAFIWLFLIIVLIYSFFFSWGNEVYNEAEIENNSSLNQAQIFLSDENSVAYIIFESWKKVEIKDSIYLNKSERVSVESWNVDISFPLEANMKLSENWDFSYKQDWSFFLDSGDVWIEALKDINVSMKYWDVYFSSDSVWNLKQNEIETGVYSISWNIEVSNLAWISTDLENWYKIDIRNNVASSNDVDLNSLKEEIDDYFRLSSWFKLNWWPELLKDVETNTWSLMELDTSSLINFDNVKDEGYADSNPIDLKWRFSPNKVWKITINSKEVKMDKDLGIFWLQGLTLSKQTNDFVVKIFDQENNILAKKVLTLYSNSPIGGNGLNNNSSAWLENYSVNQSDFVIYEPTTTWKLTTTSSRVTIRGKVSNKDVASVRVNDYTLKSYNGSTWRYHAFVEQDTLKDWANNYEIEYLNSKWEVIYKEYFSIFKRKPWSIVPVSSWNIGSQDKGVDLMSWEVEIE